MCFELMVTLSVLLRKTLVIPADLYSPITDVRGHLGGTNVRRRPPNPRDLFDLTRLGSIVDIVVGRSGPPTPRLAKKTPHRLDINPIEEAICFPSFPPKNSPRFRELLAFLADRRAAVALTEEIRTLEWIHVGKALGHFYTSFFLNKRQDVFFKKLFREQLAFHPMIIQAAMPLARKLGSYSAIHVRRGDFSVQYPGAVVPAEVIVENIQAKIPVGSRLYIATNERDRSFFDPIARAYDVQMFSDVREDRNYLPYVAACADMLICASARVFVGNRLSTFSGYITRLRGYRKAANTEIFFTDQRPTNPRRRRKSSRPRFSWQESIAAGTPIWGREYREGWEFDEA
jgi:hypothetical protein